MAPKRRRLTDLYLLGEYVEFDDNSGEPPIRVYVRKLTPADQQNAVRKANITRSRLMASRNDPESESFQAYRSELEEFDHEGLVKFLVEDERANKQPAIEAEVAAGEEWSGDGYLEGLQEGDPEGESSENVVLELQRYTDEVDAAIGKHLDEFRRELESRTEDALKEQVFDKIVKLQASIEWLTEYRKCEIYYSVREEDRSTRYFTDRTEVDELPSQVLGTLAETYQRISVEPTEGKDLGASQDSSPSSEPVEEAEPDSSSGLQIVGL